MNAFLKVCDCITCIEYEYCTEQCVLLEVQYYRICSSNLRTFFPILAAEKSGCVKYVEFFFVEVLIWVLF